MKPKRNPIIILAFSLGLALLPTASYAGLDGQIVKFISGGHRKCTISGRRVFKLYPLRFSGETVGPDVEFTTVATEIPAPFIWTINVDLTDTSIIVNWTESTHGATAGAFQDGLLNLDFTFAQPIISNVSFSSFINTSSVFHANSAVELLATTPDSINLEFEGMLDGDIYTFDVTTVPEPSSLLLAATGLFFLASAFKRNRSTRPPWG